MVGDGVNEDGYWWGSLWAARYDMERRPSYTSERDMADVNIAGASAGEHRSIHVQRGSATHTEIWNAGEVTEVRKELNVSSQ